MPIINEIDAALARHAPYTDKVVLFAKYANNLAMLRTFQLRSDRKTKEALDYQLRRLRWKPGVRLISEVVMDAPELKELVVSESLPIQPEKKIVQTAYPDIIARAIRERQKAVNNREKAGRILTSQVESMSTTERANLIQSQKELHKIVVAKTRIINAWRNDGTLPEEIKSLPDDQKKEFEAEWTEGLRSLSRAKKSINQWAAKKNQVKVIFYEKKRDTLDARLDELAILLNRKRRK